MNNLEELALFISEFDICDAPGKVIHSAELCVLDTVGVAIGGSVDPLVESVARAFLQLDRSSQNAAICGTTVWGTGSRASAPRAAFLNAMNGHILELDDVHTRSKTHIGTVVIPAAWAGAEETGASGSDFLEAVICGYEAMARIGMGFGVTAHRERGWHVTGTAGTFGAAAACAKLLKLDSEGVLNALALAGAQSFGVWAFLSDGSANKILHPASASRIGMEAAYLAKAGMTGPRHILEAEDGGLFPAMSGDYDLSKVSAGLGVEWELTRLDKKPYPCCRSAHCAIDAALDIKRGHSPDIKQIESVRVNTYNVGYAQCGASGTSVNPGKPSDARFSIPYTVACALLYDNVGLEHFEPEFIHSESVRALMSRVRVFPDAAFSALYPEHWGCEMIVTLHDGRVLSAVIRDASGSEDNPMTDERVIAKAVSCAAISIGWARAKTMADSVLGIASRTALPDLAAEETEA